MPEKTLREALVDVADAIRAKTESQETMTIEEMPGEIASIITPTGTKNIVANGDNIDVYNYASVNVNVPNPSSGTLEITENGDGIDVSQYAYVDVDVQGGGSFEANYLYPTDENGAVLTDQGMGFSEYNVYYKEDDVLSTSQPSAGSVYFFEDTTPTPMILSSNMIYYYDGNTCSPLSPCFESNVEDGKIYIGDTNISELIREIAYPQDCEAIMYAAAEDDNPQEGDLYIYNPGMGCYPLVKEYIYKDRLYWWSSSGTGFMYSNEMDADVPYLVSAGSNDIPIGRVGILDVGQEVTVELDGNTYKVTRIS